jgi:hypothetical protein
MKAIARLAFCCLAACVLAASPALAGDAFSLDLGINGGISGTQNTTNSSVFVGGAQARLHLVWLLAAELRGSYYTNSYKVSDLGGVDVKNMPIQASVLLYLLKLPGFGLHILGGGTYNAVTLDGTGNINGSVKQDKWAAHAGAGVDFNLGKHFVLNVDGRYVFLNVDPQNLPPPSSGSYKGDYWTGTVGLNWKVF